MCASFLLLVAMKEIEKTNFSNDISISRLFRHYVQRDQLTNLSSKFMQRISLFVKITGDFNDMQVLNARK